MLIRYVCLTIAALSAGAAISSGFFAFISLIGVFPKLAEKIKVDNRYMLIETMLTLGAALTNVVYIFNIRLPLTIIGLAVFTLFGGIFTGCLAGALTEVLNVFPIISRRFSVRRYIPYVIYAVAAGKLIGSIIGLLANGLV